MAIGFLPRAPKFDSQKLVASTKLIVFLRRPIHSID